MMHSTGTTNNSFVRKDLLCRNGIYYLVDDILKHEDTLHMREVILVHKLRNLVANNPKHDLCWAVLQTYDPITHEPIPKHHDHISSNSAVSSPSVQSINSPQPTNISTTTSTIPTAIPTTTTSNTTTTPTTSSAFSIPSIAHAHISSPVPTSNQNLPQTPVQSSSSTNNNSSTPHIAKSFRSPPPSDYFVNNAANLSYLSISQYFKLPLHEACVALRVDESSLKKRCRELGIRRWPYRKRCNISSGKGNAQTQQAEEQSSNGDQLFSCFQLNKGKGSSPVVQKMKSEEALALEALDKLHNVSKPTPTTTSSTTATATSTTSAQPTTVEQPRTTTTVNVAHPQQRTAVPPPTTGAYTYPPYPHPGYPPHMYQPHPGYHYPYGVPPTHDGSQPVPYPMYYPPQNSAIPPPGAYPPPPGTETKDGQPTYVQPYYYDYRGYPYPPPQSGSVPPYPYPPQPGYSYPPHPEQSAYPYPPHGYPPMAYPPHQMGYPPHPVPQQQVPKPVIVSTSPAESQPVSGTPCRTVSGSTGDQTPTTPIGSPQTKMVYQRETKVLHPVRYKPPSPTESTAEIVAKIKRERIEDQDDNAKKVRRDIQIANPLCNPVSSQTVQNGPLSTSIKVADK